MLLIKYMIIDDSSGLKFILDHLSFVALHMFLIKANSRTTEARKKKSLQPLETFTHKIVSHLLISFLFIVFIYIYIYICYGRLIKEWHFKRQLSAIRVQSLMGCDHLLISHPNQKIRHLNGTVIRR